MSANAAKRRRLGIATAVTMCVAGAGIAFGGSALGESSEADRTKLVDVPEAGIAVPARTTELVNVAKAEALNATVSGRTVFRAPGAGEYDGLVCIFTARPTGGTDVVPVVCDSPEAVRTKGLDLGVSALDGGISGVVVRDVGDGSAVAETYKVGPEGGTVTVRPGGGSTVILTFPNLRDFDARANQDARDFARSGTSMQP